jgi:non-homologous end joining protein Ku
MATHTKPSTPDTNAASYRAFKTVTLSLNGITTFPAKLISATSEEKSPFRLCVVKDGKALPVSQFYTADNKEYFPIGQLGRAIEMGESLIPLTAEEISSTKKIDEEDVDHAKKSLIELTSFVPLAQVDPVFFLNGYVILPNLDTKGKGNPQAANLYHILLRALLKSGRVGVAKMYDRDREYNIIVRPSTDGKRLMLHTIYTSNEVRVIDVPSPTVIVDEMLVDQGVELISLNFSNFDATSVFSQTDNAVASLVARKKAEANGETVPDTPHKTSTTNVGSSLLDSLTASVNMAKAKKATPATTTTASA